MCELNECDNTFTPVPSKQKGKRRQKFCSTKCRAAGANQVRDSGATIPADVFLARIEPLLGKVGENRYTGLSTACNLKADSLLKALSRDQIDFDLCDLILCKLNAVHAWWTEPLDTLYWNVDLA